MTSMFRKIYETSPQSIYRYFANKRRSLRNRRFIQQYLASHQTKKLHIGCGGNYLDTWLNSDLVPDNSNIVRLDASKTFPLETGSFDYVYSEHLIEHLSFGQQLNYLKESFRILKPGGKIRIATPDFDFLMQLAAINKSDFENEYLKWNYNTFLHYIPSELMSAENINVYVINNYFRDWGHQLIHNKSSLKNLTEYCGFQINGFEKVGCSNDPVFARLERHGEMITERYNKYETMVLEAIKV